MICTSPNSVIVHGIPGPYRLEEGDILSLDCGAIIEGYHGDAAVTIPIGEVSAEAQKLLEVTRQSLEAGIEQIRDGNRLYDIGEAVQTVAEGAGFSVVREYVGHGIGTAMHEPPADPQLQAPRQPGHQDQGRATSSRWSRWSTPASPDTTLLDDGWTVVTADGSLSAHFEHTIAVTDDGPEVLTVAGLS